MRSCVDLRVEPSSLSSDTLRRLTGALSQRGEPMLIGCDGERIALPWQLRDALGFAVGALERHQAVRVLSEDEALTTHQAARLLGVSRPHLLKLLDEGRIPFHRVGTHRRLLLQDVVAYRETRQDGGL